MEASEAETEASEAETEDSEADVAEASEADAADAADSTPKTKPERQAPSQASKALKRDFDLFINNISNMADFLENDSEDEGIEDYKMGGYHAPHIG